MKIFILLLVLLLTQESNGNSFSNIQNLYKHKPASYSYIIGNINKQNTDMEHDADIYITPASCQKTITALIILKILGPQYRYKTILFKSNNNDIILKFSGDPSLTTKNLINLLQPLANKKINNLILDSSIFKTPEFSQNIIIDDIGTEYLTPTSSINIDKNIIQLKICPSKKIGQKPTIYSDVLYKIISKIITNNEKSSIEQIWNKNSIEIAGNINIKDKCQKIKISPQNTETFAIKKLYEILKELNIESKSITVTKNDTKKTQIQKINEIQSKTIKELMKEAFKKSENLTFDALYLTLANLHSQKTINNWNNGDKIIKMLIKQNLGVDLTGSLLVDGSGISRYNRIQPKKLFTILKKGMYVDDFLDLFPYPGEKNSTLEKRTILPQNIRAKTGTMSGISCLCGYTLNTKNNPEKIFVVTASNFNPPIDSITNVIDTFINRQLYNTQKTNRCIDQ